MKVTANTQKQKREGEIQFYCIKPSHFYNKLMKEMFTKHIGFFGLSSFCSISGLGLHVGLQVNRESK